MATNLSALLDKAAAICRQYEWALDNHLYKHNDPTAEIKECQETENELEALAYAIRFTDPKLLNELLAPEAIFKVKYV